MDASACTEDAFVEASQIINPGQWHGWQERLNAAAVVVGVASFEEYKQAFAAAYATSQAAVTAWFKLTWLCFRPLWNGGRVLGRVLLPMIREASVQNFHHCVARDEQRTAILRTALLDDALDHPQTRPMHDDCTALVASHHGCSTSASRGRRCTFVEDRHARSEREGGRGTAFHAGRPSSKRR